MSNEITIPEHGLIAKNGFDEDSNGVNIQFPRIPFPSGRSLTFNVKDATGQEKPVTSLTGKIICNFPINQRFEDKYDPTKPKPPDCFSKDAITGIETATGKSIRCSTCQYNVFIDNKKVCKNQRKIFILLDGAKLPTLIILPPTSLKAWAEYVYELKSKGLNSNMVETEISLLPEKSNGYDFSSAHFQVKRILTQAEYDECYEVHQGLVTFMTNQTIQEQYPEAFKEEEPFIPDIVEAKEYSLSQEEALKIHQDFGQDDSESQEKDRKLAQMILSKTGFSSSNETARHQLVQELTGKEKTATWEWKDIKLFLTKCKALLGIEQFPPEIGASQYLTLKKAFDSIVANREV